MRGESSLMLLALSVLLFVMAGVDGACNTTTASGSCATCNTGYYGSTCASACTCVNGTCDGGTNGTGYCSACNTGYYGHLCDTWVPQDTEAVEMFEMAGMQLAMLMAVVLWTAMAYGYHMGTMPSPPPAAAASNIHSDDEKETKEEKKKEEGEVETAEGVEDHQERSDDEDDGAPTAATAGGNKDPEDDDGEAGAAGVKNRGDTIAGDGHDRNQSADGETAEDGEDVVVVAKKEDGPQKDKPKGPKSQPTQSTSDASSKKEDGGSSASQTRNELEPAHFQDEDSPHRPPRARSMGRGIATGAYGQDGKGDPITHDSVGKCDHAPPPPTMSASTRGRGFLLSSASQGSGSGLGAGGAGGMTRSLSRPDAAAGPGPNFASATKRSSSVKRRNLPPTRSVSVAENAQDASATNRGSTNVRQQSSDPFGTPFASTVAGSQNAYTPRSMSEPMMMGTPMHQQQQPAQFYQHPPQPAPGYYYGPPYAYGPPQQQSQFAPAAYYTPQAAPPPQHEETMAPVNVTVSSQSTGPTNNAAPRAIAPQHEHHSQQQPQQVPALGSAGPRPASTQSTPRVHYQDPVNGSSNGHRHSNGQEGQSDAQPNPIAKRATELAHSIPAQPLSNEVSPERKQPAQHKFVEGDTLRRNYLHPEILCNFGGNVQEVLCGEQIIITRAVTEYLQDPVDGSVAITQYYVSGGDQACPHDIEPLFTLQGNALNGGTGSNSMGRAKSGGSARASMRPATPTDEDDEPRVRFEQKSAVSTII